MSKRIFAIFMVVCLVAANLIWVSGDALATDPPKGGSTKAHPGKMTQAERKAAAGRLANTGIKPKAVSKKFAGVSPATAAMSPLAAAVGPLAAMAAPGSTPDYFGTIPNYANSPLPVVDPTTGAISGGIRKFVDTLPGLGAVAANDLGQYIPVAAPDRATYAGSDYYEIELGEYTEQLHKDLPPTRLRGYRQTNTTDPAISKFSYLGPTIIAQKDRPVRVKFTNKLATGVGGNLFLPVDTTVMGAGPGPTGGSYTQNRATLHLHGGATPWISDGTQHQWITPNGEATSYPQGVSVQEVPDMGGANCGAPNDGCQTFYYTNQQSAKLMFYHDHAYGITRLNVYAGEAAGYLLRDTVEQALISNGTIPADEIPLIIQDKTFVPDAGDPGGQLAAQDPTWDVAKWGGKGNLWFPDVYMPNQNPADVSGANAVGRWDYGPWFWPPFTGMINGPLPNPLKGTTAMEGPVNPGTPNPSIVPEGFMDTPLVNGTAYPSLTVQPKTYRLRILNASNDRFWNLQLYQAVSNNQMWNPDGTLADANAGEVPMVPAVAGQPGTAGYPADITDGRDGGVPDVTKKGPSMIQIGTEGGFLPAPAVLNNTPIGYNYNRRDITVLNVSTKNLFLGPAERGDVIVDFSQFAGKTLIMYNDAPAPVPAFDPRNDYYTGDPDNTPTGGAPSTIPGYGPNTRTVMQIKVAAATPAPVFNLGALNAALPAAYAASQDKPIVPQAVYNAAFPGLNAPTDVSQYSTIQATSMTFTPAVKPVTSIQLTAGGNGYTSPPTVSFSGGGGTGAAAEAAITGIVSTISVGKPGSGYTSAPIVQITGGGGTGAIATATVSAGQVAAITVTNPGSGYTSPPTVSLTGGGGKGATATANLTKAVSSLTLTSGGSNYTSAPTVSFSGGGGASAAATASVAPVTMDMEPKSIIEDFDADYGRMDAMLGVEIPRTNANVQTSIPYYDIDPPTEIFKANSSPAATIGTLADGTQIWKITHNGVDTHAMHWHMFNVQLINRVGWDGAIKPPEANEVGWKETIRMNPLEDIIVAARPIPPNVPFDLPNSIRALDVTTPLGTAMPLQFHNIDPINEPANVVNRLVNFGWEYVWHCHLLGHEENIMMRPMAVAVAPKAPSNLVAAPPTTKGVTVTWTDTSKNETRFTVQRATSAGGPWATVGAVASTTGPATGGTATFTDPAPVKKVTNFYRVIANNVVGDTTQYTAPTAGYPNVSADSAPSSPSNSVTP